VLERANENSNSRSIGASICTPSVSLRGPPRRRTRRLGRLRHCLLRRSSLQFGHDPAPRLGRFARRKNPDFARD
jgi:hypothetical protein